MMRPSRRASLSLLPAPDYAGALRVQATSGTRETKPRLAAEGQRGARLSMEFTTSISACGRQTPDLSKAQDFVAKNPGYQIKPIQVGKANTAFLFHSHEAALNQNYREGKCRHWSITPNLGRPTLCDSRRITQHGRIPGDCWPAAVRRKADGGRRRLVQTETFWSEMSEDLAFDERT